MKLVLAVIKPFRLYDVRLSLQRLGVHGLTITEAMGYGRQKGHSERYRGTEYAINFLPKIRLEIIVKDSLLDAVLEAIQSAAVTERIGDGKIFVLNVEQACRIRTGEMGEQALV